MTTLDRINECTRILRDFNEAERARSVEAAALSMLWNVERELHNIKWSVTVEPFERLDALAGKIDAFLKDKMPTKETR